MTILQSKRFILLPGLCLVALMATAAKPVRHVSSEVQRTSLRVLPDDVATTLLDDEEPIEVTLTKLIAAKYEPGESLDEEIQDYDGKKVTITGLMALGTLEGQETFELTSDACGCGQSKVNHFVKVTLVDEYTSYTPSEITVTGTFEASEEIVDGFVISVYRITADKIEE